MTIASDLWRRYLPILLQGLKANPQPPESHSTPPLPPAHLRAPNTFPWRGFHGADNVVRHMATTGANPSPRGTNANDASPSGYRVPKLFTTDVRNAVLRLLECHALTDERRDSMSVRRLSLLGRLRSRSCRPRQAETVTDNSRDGASDKTFDGLDAQRRYEHDSPAPDQSSKRSAHWPKRRRWSPADIAATSLLMVFVVSAACASSMCSLRFVMATNACPVHCHSPGLEGAFVVTWAGIAMAFILIALGLATAAWRGRAMWIWPTLALAVLATTTASGLLMAGEIHAWVVQGPPVRVIDGRD